MAIATEADVGPRSLTTAFLLAMATHAGTLGATVSLHGTDPGATGAGEISGGGYIRGATVWGAAAMNGANAEIVGSDVTFTVPASTAVNFYGVWAGSVFQYGAALNPPVTTGAGGAAIVVVTPKYQEQPGA
jgi:hypothetical protein